MIPGMGPEDKIDFTESLTADREFIPGLDLDVSNFKDRNERDKKIPYSKPIPRNFVAQWNDPGRPNDDDGPDGNNGSNQARHPSAIIVYGVTIPVQPDTRLAAIIAEGPMILNRFISARGIPELNDLLPADEPLPDGDETDPSRFYDHNVEIIFENDTSVQLPPMNAPPPGSMDVEINLNEPPPDFRGLNNNNGSNMSGDRDDRDMWQQQQHNGPPPMQWQGPGPAGNPFAMGNNNMSNPPPNMMNNMGGGMDGNGPMNGPNGNNMDGPWNGPPPGMRMDGGMMDGGFRNRGPDKFRRMDEDGRRISRFDDGGNMRNRRPINNMNESMDMMNNGNGGGFGGFGGNRFGNNHMDNNGPPNNNMNNNMMGGPNNMRGGPNHMMGNNNFDNNNYDNNNFDNNNFDNSNFDNDVGNGPNDFGNGPNNFGNGPNDFGNMGGNHRNFNNRGSNRAHHRRF